MDAVWINVGLAFLEGFALIISPCILPILPIILSGSLTGRKSRPIGIILGFIVTFTLVTLFSGAIISLFNLNPETLRYVSFGILFLLGLVMTSTYLSEKFSFFTQGMTRVGGSSKYINNPQSGFWGGLLFGALVGIIWTPCAGPILAAVIVQIVILQTSYASVLTLLAFAIGAGLPMLLIAFFGRRIIDKYTLIYLHPVLFRKILGFIIMGSVLFLFYTSGEVSLSLPNPISNQQKITSPTALIDGLYRPYKAPDIAGIDAWINSPPLTLSELKNKVVLLDFWTYSCINCIHTFPYLKEWYAKYHDKGLVIIGIHSPEFAFEHDLENVKNAVAKYGILYPVALDNNFVTWRNYKNRYWPAHYLINKDGEVVYEHFGEGDYDVTENNIRYLLGLKGKDIKSAITKNNSYRQTPETYLGYARGQNFASPEEKLQNKPRIYTYPPVLSVNDWALKGEWIIYPDKVVAASSNASIKLHFRAQKVYAVMGGFTGSNINVIVRLNGKPIKEQWSVGPHQLYSLINSSANQESTVELIAVDKGLEVYTFTFE